MRLLSSLLMFLLCAPLLASERTLPESNVLGEACPELLLEEEMVQGEQITWESLQGKVVLFLFYQRECEGCERLAMPRIQKMHEKWSGSHCWLVFVINTAFDKDVYPYLADVEETRKHLKRMEWTMPVARDLDEQSNLLFTLDDQPGTPQAVVMDEHGIVRAHDWYSEEEEMKRIDTVFEGLASSMNCKCVRMPREVTCNCQGSREAFAEGRYHDAFTRAQDIIDGTGYTKEDKVDAEYMQNYIDDVLETRIERITTHYDRDPEAALARADDAVKDFNGLDRVSKFAATVEKWRGSDHLASFRANRKDLAKLEADIAKAGETPDEETRKSLVDRLGTIADRAGRTVVAEDARRHIQRISPASITEGRDAVADSSAGRAGSTGDNGRSDDDRSRAGSSGGNDGASGGTRVGGSGGGNTGDKVGGSGQGSGSSDSSKASRAGTSSETSRHRNVRKAR